MELAESADQAAATLFVGKSFMEQVTRPKGHYEVPKR